MKKVPGVDVFPAKSTLSSDLVSWMCGSGRTSRYQVIKGQLQQKIIKKTGTLIKKTKVIYGDSYWVVLCLHDNKIPILEWYNSPNDIDWHDPFKVYDLLFARDAFIAKDPRSFIIEFAGEEPIELVAVDNQSCEEWLLVTKRLLKGLEILEKPSNKHVDEKVFAVPPPLPRTAPPPLHLNPDRLYSRSFESIASQLPRSNPQGTSPSRPIPIQTSHHSIGSTMDVESSKARRSTWSQGRSVSSRDASLRNQVRPPVPRHGYVDPDTSLTTAAVERQEAHQEEVSSTTAAERPHQEEDNYSIPKGILLPYEKMGYVKFNESNHSTPSLANSLATSTEVLSPAQSCTNISSSPLESTLSSTSLYSVSDPHEFSAVHSFDTPDDAENGYGSIRDVIGYTFPTKNLCFSLSTIVENIMFVEVGDRTWVVGWTEDKKLEGHLSFGDELLEVSGCKVTPHCIPQIFYNKALPGNPLALVLRPTPLAVLFTLVKPINRNKEIGLLMHKKKNKIDQVVADSSAANRGMKNKMPAFLTKGALTGVVITDINNRRLNIFCKNDQMEKRLKEIKDGSQFTLRVHPHDFVKEVKTFMMSTNKNYKAYLGSPN